eukprot:365152-Chlamydomonas_euryale.AAC.4
MHPCHPRPNDQLRRRAERLRVLHRRPSPPEPCVPHGRPPGAPHNCTTPAPHLCASALFTCYSLTGFSGCKNLDMFCRQITIIGRSTIHQAWTWTNSNHRVPVAH